MNEWMNKWNRRGRCDWSDQWDHRWNREGIGEVGEIVINPQNPIVKTILYVYTMETWLYPELNKASRNHDESKIMLLGPYACALGLILAYCDCYGRKNDPESF